MQARHYAVLAHELGLQAIGAAATQPVSHSTSRRGHPDPRTDLSVLARIDFQNASSSFAKALSEGMHGG